MAKRAKDSAPESGIVKVVDPLYDVPTDADPQPSLPPPPAGSSVRQGLRRFFELLLRLVSWVIIFTIFGAALYYGLPMLYQQFVAPVEQNTVQMVELQSKLAETEQELADLQTRLQTLENDQAKNNKALNSLDERVGSLETEIEARTKSLAALEEMQSELETQNESAAAELQRQINILKAMELMSRARLFMYQSNFGLARQDVLSARDLLEEIEPEADNSLASELDAVVRRLDMVLSNLPSFPVAASDDLDIAWQILLSGMPPAPPNIQATAVPAGTSSVTPAATLTTTPQPTTSP